MSPATKPAVEVDTTGRVPTAETAVTARATPAATQRHAGSTTEHTSGKTVPTIGVIQTATTPLQEPLLPTPTPALRIPVQEKELEEKSRVQKTNAPAKSRQWFA